MLSPEYLDSIEFNDVVELYNKLNIDITADIIERVSQMQDITETTLNQLRILKQTIQSYHYIFYKRRIQILSKKLL